MKVFAIVGKPNVGKSTFFNRLVRKRLAIVHDEPGVTRDRNLSIVDYKGYHFIIIDTGGFDLDVKEVIPQKMREQAHLAIEEADGIIFFTDRTLGWTLKDSQVLDILRRSEKPLYFVVNKVDSPNHEVDLPEFYESGVEKLFAISAAHGRGVSDLLEEMAKDFPTIIEEDSNTPEKEQISIAIVGRPNAGKSSLTNALLGETKQIVDSTPGTTRDSVDSFCKYHGKKLKIIDTAGIRQKSRVSYRVDQYSMVAAIKSIERCDVVLLVIDATEGVVEQDARIAGYVLDRGKSIIIIYNKWDLVSKDNKTLEKTKQEIRDQLAFLSFAPILFISAQTGKRVSNIFDQVMETYAQYTKRIQTSDLNQILQSIILRHSPPSKGKRRTKLYYTAQVSSAPPSFIITSNNPAAINTSYQRFMNNQFRHFFGFEGTPIRIFWRDKKQSNNAGEESK